MTNEDTVSGDDFDLDAALGDAFDNATAVDDAPQTDDRPRDEHGRFIARTEDEQEQPQADAGADEAAAAAKGEETTEENAGSADQQNPDVPPGWKPEEAEFFRNLPTEVQQAITRRQTELQGVVTRKAQELGTLGQVGQRLHSEVFGPRASSLIAQGIDPVARTAELWGYADNMARDPAGTLAALMRDSGVTIEQLAQAAGAPMPGGQSGYDPQEPAQQISNPEDDPRIRPLLERINALESRGQEAILNEKTQTLSQWAAEVGPDGQPLRPYLDDVFDDMLATIQTVQARYPHESDAQKLDRAYAAALAMNPQIQARAEETRRAQEAAAAARQRDEQARKAARGGRTARTMGVSARGATPTTGGNLDETLAAAYDRAVDG